MRSAYFSTSAGALHYVEEGTGPCVVLLHGFPEFWYSWRHQIPALAAAGYRVVAPDLRGYNLSHKPRGLSEYRAFVVADEIAEFIQGIAPGKRCAIVAHDWGAVIGWLLATRHRELASRLAVLSVPHLPALRRMRRADQLSKFWYQFVFQPPYLPEFLLRRGHFALLAKMMRKLSRRREAMTNEVLDRYRDAWAQPEALTSMLDYYRALFRRQREFPKREAALITIPTLMIYGSRDHLFAPELYEISRQWLDDGRIGVVPGGGHFVHHDAPEVTNELLLSFLRAED